MGKKSSWPTTKPGSEANKVSEGEIATAGNWSSGSNTLWKHTSPLHRLLKMQACVWLDTSKTQIWWLIQQIFHFVGVFFVAMVTNVVWNCKLANCTVRELLKARARQSQRRERSWGNRTGSEWTKKSLSLPTGASSRLSLPWLLLSLQI